MAHLEPFLLAPVFSERPWGGDRLRAYGKDLPADVLIGESWEVADLPDGVTSAMADPRSRVAEGSHVGLSLGDLILAHESELMGTAEPTPEGRFPLLVKLIDAREPLSVQVHPPAAYIANHPEARLKTESWYVVEAGEGGVLHLDIEENIPEGEALAAVGSPAIVHMLGHVDAVAGVFQHVPAGLVHAIGADVLIAEVQTPSDTTYRIYDWSEELGRKPRPMHPDQAKESIRFRPDEAFMLEPLAPSGVRDLISCDHYWMREHRGVEGDVMRKPTGGPAILMVLAGSATIDALDVPTGGTAIIPACAPDAHVMAEPGSTLLEIGLVD